MVICLERGADLHVAQLTPLPLTVSCFSKIQIGFTFLVLAHPCVKSLCDSQICFVYYISFCLNVLINELIQFAFLYIVGRRCPSVSDVYICND